MSRIVAAPMLVRPSSLAIVGLLASAGCSPTPPPPPSATAAASDPERVAEGGVAAAPETRVGVVTVVRGPGGLTSSHLTQGTLLGPGAAVAPGQDLQTPKGTLAEIQWGDARLRLNEDSSIRIPASEGEAIALERGAVVVLGSDDAPVAMLAGSGRLEVQGGEAEVRVEGERQHFAVLSGVAELVVDGHAQTLRPGDSVELPRPAATAPANVVSSLAPFQETAWAQSFATTAATQSQAALPRGMGTLTARRAGSTYEYQPLRLVDQRVTVKISGAIAYTEIEQAFHNEHAEELEGIYRFPIPTDASLSDLSLLVGHQWVQGAVVEKNRGRQIFDAIVDATVPRDPALLEWQRGGSFKLRVFPIPGHGERRVRLAYTQVLSRVGGKLRYRFPLEGNHAGGTAMDRFRFAAQIDGRELTEAQIEGITSSMLDLRRHREGETIVLDVEREHFVPTFDVGIDVPTTDSSAAAPSVHTDRDGQTYFMVQLQPEFESPAASQPTHYAFVVDRSYSTASALWPTVRATLASMMEMLGTDDRLTVLACDTACDSLEGGLLAPSEDSARRVDTFLDAQSRWGASDLGAMLQGGRTALAASTDARRVVVYLGDGVATSGELTPEGLRRALQEWKDTSVLAVAIGGQSDLTMLRAVARTTGGDVVQADARDDAAALVRELHLRARVPALRDPTFTFPAAMTDVHPLHADAIRSGETITLVGRLRGPVDDTISLRGHGPSGPFEQRFPVELAPRLAQSDTVAHHLPRTWAQAELEGLTQTRGHAARQEIVALSTRYNVLSRYTALLVLENDAMFRAFGVERHAADKDSWTGAIPEAKGDIEALDIGDDRDAQSPPAEVPSQNDVKRKETRSAASPPSPPASAASSPRAVPRPADEWPLDNASAEQSAKAMFEAQMRAQRHYAVHPRLQIAAARRTISSRMQRRIEELHGQVERAPTSRTAHSRLVRTAGAVGHPQTLTFAHAWVAVDPEHAPALYALADAMAAAGDPMALRVYESVLELHPFAEDAHERLAVAYQSKGDPTRECSHRHALHSIAPQRPAYAREWTACEAGTPRTVPQLASGAQLRASLEWSEDAGDLDIAVFDSRGRRLSALRPDGIQVRESRGREELTLRRIHGTINVVVTRRLEPEVTSPLRATLTLRTPDGRRTFPLELTAGSTSVGRVSWNSVR